MASRVTQETRVSLTDTPAGGGASRVTQLTRLGVVDIASAALGGDTRITQITRVVIGTIDLAGGNASMLRGMI